jgi:protocatechuate 3,4-dioxygenase beta subunit
VTRFFVILFASLLLTGGTVIGQNAPVNLTAELTVDGYVQLSWQTPVGQLPYRYEIWRGTISPNLVIAQLYSHTAKSYIDYNVSYGEEYAYMVVAVYPGPAFGRAFTSIRVIPKPRDLKFISDPKTTVRVGTEYFYAPSVDAERPEEIAFDLVGERPEGMTVNNVFGGPSYLHWSPREAGAYRITLLATNTVTGARAVQEFTINVADKVGVLRGSVKTITNQPLAGAIVRFWQTSARMNLTYEVRTDHNGEFRLENVQVGRIYAYAQSPNEFHESQYYINAPDISNALERVLDTLNNNTLNYEFYLFASAGNPTPVTLRVVNESGTGIPDAKVSFIRKKDFIHIGDTASINAVAMDAASTWSNGIVDTVLFTDFKGMISVDLPVGREYYTIVEKDQYLSTFVADETNAMLAKAVRIENGTNLNYTLTASGSTSNQVYGKVSSQVTGVPKQATVVLIDSELKRGAGGGHTYRKYRSVVTDSNGVFNFGNLPDSPPSALLAIPMDATLAPQYYHSNGGRLNFIESEELSPLGTLQNINFSLQETIKRSGIGSYFGQVLLREGAKRIPVPGTIVFAEDEASGKLSGYAISDSTGWYSITGLEPGNYLLYADNPNYSNNAIYSEATATVTLPATMAYINSVDLNRNQRVNFHIDDLRTTVGIGTEPMPTAITLAQNYPNPFNPSTTIRFSVPSRQHVTLRVINTLGEVVATLVDRGVDAGHHAVTFTADGLTSGIYYAQLQSDGITLGKAMMLVK